MRTSVYIDGLNLYYGSLKNTPYKWLDVKTLSSLVLGDEYNIQKIKLFTTIVKPTETNPNVHLRQRAYLNALKHLVPELKIFYGHFSEHRTFAPLAQPQGKNKFAEIIKREEKGSDVSLAVHFLNDAYKNDYDCGVIISNDSDLSEAVKLVKEETNKNIGIISPFEKISKELSRYSDFQRKIRPQALNKSQMPDKISGTNLYKPKEWKK